MQRHMSGFEPIHLPVPLHQLHPWQARFSCADSDYFWHSAPLAHLFYKWVKQIFCLMLGRLIGKTNHNNIVLDNIPWICNHGQLCPFGTWQSMQIRAISKPRFLRGATTENFMTNSTNCALCPVSYTLHCTIIHYTVHCLQYTVCTP